jgi:flagellar assembly factor FliW
MLINSPRLGAIEVDEASIVEFPEGLLGFRDFKRYYFHEPSPASALLWMQCVDLPALGFVVSDPRLFMPDYSIGATAAQLEPIRLEGVEHCQVWVILTIPEDPSKLTANLQGPIVVNVDRKLGAQLVLNEEGMTTKYPVMAAMAGAGQGDPKRAQ